MIHHRHHLIRVDEKSPHHVSNNDSIPHPELDLYRSTLRIDGNGSRELNRLGAKSRWRTSLLETKMDKKHAELAKEKLGWFDKEKQHVLEELKEQIVGLDRAKGDVLRELGVRTGEFFGAIPYACVDLNIYFHNKREYALTSMFQMLQFKRTQMPAHSTYA
jgi:hypothetical protein